jgi:hypothetical protein
VVYSMTESSPNVDRCTDAETTLQLDDAHAAAALRGHLSGVAATTTDVAAGLDEGEVVVSDLGAALTEVEELAALLEELSP